MVSCAGQKVQESLWFCAASGYTTIIYSNYFKLESRFTKCYEHAMLSTAKNSLCRVEKAVCSFPRDISKNDTFYSRSYIY